jgi:endonuclease/exonuclease/phosphatase family metal-dependent hydrolase
VKQPTPIQLLAYLLALFIVLTSLSPFLMQSSISPGSSGKDIRVMSYNIQQAFNTEGILDFEMLTKTIRDANPDIIGLQESLPTRIVSSNVNPLIKLANELGYYIYNGPGPQYQTPGVSVLSKYKIESSDFVILRAENLPRTAVHVRVIVANQEVDFYSIHLGVFSDLDRQNQVEDLHKFIEDTQLSESTPKTIVGDFNDHPNTMVYNSVVSEGYNDTWVASGNALNATSGYTYDSYAPYETIDYIFTSPDITVTTGSFKVITGSYGSDHLPIYVDITIP